jgi:hypothetical protein
MSIYETRTEFTTKDGRRMVGIDTDYCLVPGQGSAFGGHTTIEDAAPTNELPPELPVVQSLEDTVMRRTVELERTA